MSKTIKDTLQDMLKSIATSALTGDSRLPDEYIDDALKEIEACVRNEKLKLLAGVRERVVGEDQPDIADCVEQYANKARLSELKDFRKNWHTMIRQEVHQDLNDRIAKLTKLEAEL